MQTKCKQNLMLQFNYANMYYLTMQMIGKYMFIIFYSKSTDFLKQNVSIKYVMNNRKVDNLKYVYKMHSKAFKTPENLYVSYKFFYIIIDFG